ncbi:MAG: hypothetical protein RIM84_16075 [Alphaproteobacteria bacterium]
MKDDHERTAADVAGQLVALYEQPFGGKRRGRYRIAMKLMRQLLGVRRVWPDQIEAIRRALYQQGFVLLDMETYFTVVSQQTFSSYRRVNESSLWRLPDAPPPPSADDLDEAAE